MRTREQLRAIRQRRRAKRTRWSDENGAMVSPNVPPFDTHRFKLRRNEGGLNFDLFYERPDGRVDLIYQVTGLEEAEPLCEDWIDGIFGEDDEEPVISKEYIPPEMTPEEYFAIVELSRQRKEERARRNAEEETDL